MGNFVSRNVTRTVSGSGVEKKSIYVCTQYILITLKMKSNKRMNENKTTSETGFMHAAITMEMG